MLILVAVLLVLLMGFIATSSNRESGDGPVASTELSEADLIARGEYLVVAGNCASCHTLGNGDYMAGGVAFETPFGTIYSTNITPDPEVGIGSWTDWDFLNSMRHGERPNGEHLYPAFPYPAFTKVTNEDLAAMFAYLQSLPASNYLPPENILAFPYNQRFLMAFWKIFFFDSGVFENNFDQSEQWNRGAYLVEALAHCSACHTPRNFLGAEHEHLFMAGGEYLDRVRSGEYKTWVAPNLTSSSRGLGLWSHQQLSDYLKTARNEFIESFGPMNEVIMNSTRFLSQSDVDSMAVYLKSLPEVPEAAPFTPDSQLMGNGRTIYNLHCGTCHLPTGEGDPEMAPRLNAGSLVVQADNPASMINAILYGPELPGTPLTPRWLDPMGEFQYILSDEEVAAVASFIRNSWDNAAGLVTPEQVAAQR
ncbi:MAG: cytochrome c [Gammaproteobacteria bacterium]|nr:cytochrome c [Gammaproteobacteria bacterium]